MPSCIDVGMCCVAELLAFAHSCPFSARTDWRPVPGFCVFFGLANRRTYRVCTAGSRTRARPSRQALPRRADPPPAAVCVFVFLCVRVSTAPCAAPHVCRMQQHTLDRYAAAVGWHKCSGFVLTQSSGLGRWCVLLIHHALRCVMHQPTGIKHERRDTFEYGPNRFMPLLHVRYASIHSVNTCTAQATLVSNALNIALAPILIFGANWGAAGAAAATVAAQAVPVVLMTRELLKSRKLRPFGFPATPPAAGVGLGAGGSHGAVDSADTGAAMAAGGEGGGAIGRGPLAALAGMMPLFKPTGGCDRHVKARTLYNTWRAALRAEGELKSWGQRTSSPAYTPAPTRTHTQPHTHTRHRRLPGPAQRLRHRHLRRGDQPGGEGGRSRHSQPPDRLPGGSLVWSGVGLVQRGV